MRQTTLSDASSEKFSKKTRKERFLEDMETTVVRRASLTPRNQAPSMGWRADRRRIRAPITLSYPPPCRRTTELCATTPKFEPVRR